MDRRRTLVAILVAILVVVAAYLLGGIGQEPVPAEQAPSSTQQR